MKIVLDPGHGQFGNKGVLSYYEGTQMWKLGQYLQANLEARGWTVTNTRPKITDAPALERRGQMAAGHDLFLSLHSNAPGPNASNYSNIRGVAIYDSVADRLDYLEVPLCAEIARLMNTPNNGVKHRWNTRADRQGQDYYGVLRNAVTVARCPDAMLIEHGYHTNLSDAAWLLLDQNLRLLAAAEVNLIDSLWRKQHGVPVIKEEDDMIFCSRGQGSTTAPDTDVLQVQTGFIKLDVEMKNPTTGEVFTVADGSYGPATSQGVKNFEKKYGMPPSDGSQFTDLHVRIMLQELVKLAEGISQADYDAERKRTQEALANASAYKDELVTIAGATAILDKYRQ